GVASRRRGGAALAAGGGDRGRTDHQGLDWPATERAPVDGRTTMHGGPGCKTTLLVVLGALIGLPAAAADYHVDCLAGDDGRDGRSPATAWRSLAKASATSYLPGDSILLKRGTRCSGTLWPRGSGERGRPVRLAAYGKGPLPVVDAKGGEAAVKLFNQQ